MASQALLIEALSTFANVSPGSEERAESLARERNSARASHKSHEADTQVTAQRPAQTQLDNQQIRTPSRGQSRSR